MAKYHRKKDGTPGICKAYKIGCPLGGSNEHFNSLDEAQEFCDKVNEEYAIYYEEECLYYNPTDEKDVKKFTIEDLAKSKSRFSRIDAIRCGYIPTYDDLARDEAQSVRAEAIEQELYLDRFCNDPDPYLKEKAISKVKESIPKEYNDDDYGFAYKVRSGNLSRELQDELCTNEYNMTTNAVNEVENGLGVTIPNHFKGEKVTFTNKIGDLLSEYSFEYIEKANHYFKDEFLSEFEIDIDKFISEQRDDELYYGIKGKDYDSHSELMLDDDSFADDVFEHLSVKIDRNADGAKDRMIRMLIENERLAHLKDGVYIETF